MNQKEMVIRELVILGKSYEWSEMAVNKIDFAHYIKMYFVTELAELIIAHQNQLDLLN